MSDTELRTDDQERADDRPQRNSRSRRSRTLLIVIIIILLLSLCVIGAVVARLVMPSSDDIAGEDERGGIEWVRSIYGWGPAEDELLVAPRKVELTDTGDILVSDQQHRFVMRFTPEGQLAQIYGDTADPVLYAVGPMAVAGDQYFFGQVPQDAIRIFSPEGEELSSFTFPSPNDIEYDDANDRLAVASNVGFVVFGPDGNPLYEIGGTQGTGPDEFDVIPGLAYGPDGTLYVLDAYNNRMSAYDVDGNRIWQVRTGKPAKGLDIMNPAEAASDDTTDTARLQVPADVTVDGAGRLVVVDSLDFSVTVFNAADGSLVAKYGDYGTKDGQFMYPTSIKYDEDRDWFVVADSGNRRVQIVRIPGSSSGGAGVVAAARRAITGPLRACIAPLVLLLVLIVAWFVLRKRRERARALEAHAEDLENDVQPGGDDADR